MDVLSPSKRPRWLRDAGVVVVLAGLLLAAYLLPADTSLRLVREAGVLRACVPASYPPLVDADPARPGIDVEILQRVADALDTRLALNRIDAMGRSFNPRSWRVTRAQCSVLAGGIVASTLTRSFLETTPSYLGTGWALIVPTPLASLHGAVVGFHAGTAGLDRIALSSYLRAQGARVRVFSSREDFTAALADGAVGAGVTEALLARALAEGPGWDVQWLPVPGARQPIALGLWKGDLTLKRAIVRALDGLVASGALDEILGRYGLAPIDERCAACS